MGMSVVYVLGPGSIWDNNEIRYSLRSLDKFLNGYGKIFIIGEKIGWLKSDIVQVPHDNNGTSRENKIFRKILRACDHPDISEDFLFINDDHFFLKPMQVNVPFFYQNNLFDHIKRRDLNSSYKRSMENTVEFLSAQKKTQFRYFDVHYPMIINKRAFLWLSRHINHDIQFGYVNKSLYCNFCGVNGHPAHDYKIRDAVSVDKMKDFIEPASIFSISDKSFPGSQALLPKLYPNKSQWEI